ncbi:MAG: bifunctional aldolase/short-chain dehydrogenase [Acidobacteria bacterium]|nr:bifunctional aldolase/short-chain dehydrogenase [Acidobacteriota bacterium]
MKSLWDMTAAAEHGGPIGECVYGSRLIGSDADLVLHGGGNTSVKAAFDDITGTAIDALYVKGSGWDLATIEAEGFTPLPTQRLRDLLDLDALSDSDMMRELSAARLDPDAPQPSVETLLHAYLPHTAVQHSHADAIVTLTNLADGSDRVAEVFGSSVVVIDYVMPGFDLAKEITRRWPLDADEDTIGMVLMNHGLFTFGHDTQTAYQHHVELITRAESWLDSHAPLATSSSGPSSAVAASVIAGLRCGVCDAAGRAMIMTRHRDEASMRFARRDDVEDLANRGPLTPDHVIRTKRVPMVGRDLDGYAAAYASYFSNNARRGNETLTMLDPAPRVIVDPELGICTIGEQAKAADIAFDIYAHTMPVLERAEDHLGGYVPLDADDLFDMEYWDLEQAKLALGGSAPPLAGMIAFLTGAASGIGKACAALLLERGAAVVGIDRDDAVAGAFDGPAWLGLSVDVTDDAAQHVAVQAAVERFGGIDIVVSSAGVFGATTPIASLSMDDWRAVQSVNVDAVAALLSMVHPILERSPVGGRVVLIGSKNVPAPGKGAGAYSASKAALTQLGRVAALEWADDSIRVNTVHPDAVFDTGLWTEELLAERARRYDMSVDQYKRRNLLSAEVTSANVADVVVSLCSDTFATTTGAAIPVDGGNERVI